MIYHEMLPGPELQPYVNCFWYFESEGGVEVQDCSFPDGSLEIIFNIQTAVFRGDGRGAFSGNPSCELIGQMTLPYQVSFRGMNRFLGVRFYPHTFSCFTSGSLHSFNDQTLDARDILGPGFREIAEIIQHEADPCRGISLLEPFLLKKINTRRRDYKQDILDFSVREIFRAQNDAVDNILRKTGCNGRFLQRLFLERVGVGPKFLQKVARFQRTFKFLNGSKMSLTEIAYACGYYDQAHFNHDFRSFTGTTPSGYLANTYPVNRHFLTEENGAYMYRFNSGKR